MFIAAQFILAIFLLSVSTKYSRKSFLEISFLFTKSNNLGNILYSLLYLPGTVIHEMSHFFVAAFLGVRTGNISLFPKTEDNRLQMGSVAIQKTDFIRSSLIGVAPFIVGSIGLLYFTSRLGLQNNLSITDSFVYIAKVFTDSKNILFTYFIIAISNTLFTSKEDRQHWPVMIIISLLAYAAIILTGNNITIGQQVKSTAGQLLMQITGSFYIAIFLNFILYILLGGISLILQKILKKKIIYKN